MTTPPGPPSPDRNTRDDGGDHDGGEPRAGVPGGPVDPTWSVDARGLRCPLPVIQLAARARDAPDGTLITVLATDPAAPHDVPAWARMRGHEMVGAGEDAGVWTLTVRVRHHG